jgi:hypothetical protein
MTSPTALEFDVFAESRDSYIFALVRAAKLTPELCRIAFSNVREAILDAREGRLMLEYDSGSSLTDEETFQLMNELTAIMPGMQIALVARDHSHKRSLEFAQVLALDRALDFRSFNNLNSAEQWLFGN